jgi:hypothetical protein
MIIVNLHSSLQHVTVYICRHQLLSVTLFLSANIFLRSNECVVNNKAAVNWVVMNVFINGTKSSLVSAIQLTLTHISPDNLGYLPESVIEN